MENTIVNGTGRRASAMPTLGFVRLRTFDRTEGELSARGGFGPAVRTATVAPSVDPFPGLDSLRTP